MSILGRNCIQGLKKTDIYFLICHLGHGHSNIVSITLQIIFHERKGKLDGVEVWRIGRQKFTPHSPIQSSDTVFMHELQLTFLESWPEFGGACVCDNYP
jgi:hypothetical protein